MDGLPETAISEHPETISNAAESTCDHRTGQSNVIAPEGNGRIEHCPPSMTLEAVPPHPLGSPSDCWTYHDEDRTVIGATARFEPPGEKKSVMPLRPLRRTDGEWTWEWRKFWEDERRPLYGLPNLAKLSNAPVILVEGEKKADAAQKLLPSYAAASWGPTGAAAGVDIAPLAGRAVIVWPDNDDVGRKAADILAQRLLAEGPCPSVRIVELPADLKEGWDLADDIPAGLDINALIASAKQIEAHETQVGQADVEWPEGFVMRAGGLYVIEKDKERKVAGAFSALAAVRDEQSSGWGFLIEWRDPDGIQHRHIVSRASLTVDPSKVRAELADGGLWLASRNRGADIIDALNSMVMKKRARSAKQTGWHQGAFVLPHRVVGNPDDDPFIFAGTPTASRFAEAGSFEEWQRNVALPCAEHPIAVMVMSAAFAGPLLAKLGVEGGGFHLVGPSSCGKTTLMHVAGSAWGGGTNGFMQTWRATSNSLEAVAAAHNHTLLVLDEIGECDPQAVGEVAYMLANGQGKGRMRSDTTAALRKEWHTLVLSTGETGIAQRIMENRFAGSPRAGQEVRLVDIAADGSTDTGVFTLSGSAEENKKAARTLADDLKTGAHATYGHAGPIFIEALIKDERTALTLINEQIKAFEENIPAEADGQVRRIAHRFAVVAAAGELAVSFGILPWEKGGAAAAVTTVFKQWLNERGSAANAEEDRIISTFRDYLQANEGNFCPVENNGVRSDRMKLLEGWMQSDAFLLTSEAFNKIARSVNVRHAKRVLHDRGFLIATRSADGKVEFSPSIRLKGVGTRRVYQIKKSILEV